MSRVSALLVAALFFCSAAAGAEEAEPKALRVAVPQEIASLSPYTPGVTENLLELVYDKLAAPTPYLADATPWLAESIVARGEDGRDWEIRLRPGIRWHDGKPFSAKDVDFTLRYYRDGPANTWTHHVSDTPRLEEIELLGRLRLRVRCAEPCPLFDKVTAAHLPILPAHIWQDVAAPHRFDGPIIGTGPYRITELKPGRYMRLSANPNYFAGTPLVKNLLVSFIRNPATAFAALRAGEFDLVGAPVPPELVITLARQPGITLLQGNKPLSAVEMRLNFERQPFADARFRKALAMAIQPAEVLGRVALGEGLPGNRGYPAPDSPWTLTGLTQTGSNPLAAQALLDELGFIDRDGDGVREFATGELLSFSLKVSSSEPLHLRAAEVVARQFHRVGIVARIEATDPARQRALNTTRQFDLTIGEIGAHGLADPDQLVQSYRSGYLWRAGLPYPELDGLIEEWEAATTADAKIAAGFALQRFHNVAPTTLVLYYPKPYTAFRPVAYNHWRAVPGQGLFHKWSLLDLAISVPGLDRP